MITKEHSLNTSILFNECSLNGTMGYFDDTKHSK